ncbi:hypothetical protein [Magnetococcus sp. PR-3]|uniref:hypothetical protein n=1 Tax=Magnetococcus sp. PR-3 TaxID=3120355 RepID=UPI002FCDF7B7
MDQHSYKNEYQAWALPLLGVFLLAFLAAILHFYFWQAPVGSDDVGYFKLALGDGFQQGDRIRHGSLRMFLYALIQFPNWVLGHDYALEAFYTSIGFQSLLGFMGVTLFAFVAAPNRRVALLAILFWVTSYAALITQAKLLPDGFGTGIAFLATGLMYGLVFRWNLPAHKPAFKALALIVGLLLWGALSIRATFAPFVLSALLLALISPHRWKLLLYFALGLLLGAALEMFSVWVQFGDPLLRYKVLLNYNTGGTLETVFEQAAKSGEKLPTLQAIILLAIRFPKVIYYTGSAEIFFFLLGGLGTLMWLFLDRSKTALSKAMMLILGFGAIAFAIKGMDPSRPYLRESIRYYLQTLPFFQLATAELIFAGASWLAITVKKPLFERGVYAVAIALITGLITLNLWSLNQSPHLAKNGNTGSLVILERASQLQEPHNPKLYGDGKNLFPLFFKASSPWAHQKKFSQFEEPGYLFINWRRRNYILKKRLHKTHPTHGLYTTIETQPHLYRHQNGRWLSDLFVINTPPITRTKTRLPKEAFMVRLQGGQLATPSETIRLVKGDQWQLSAVDPALAPLPVEKLVQIQFFMRAVTPRASTMQVQLEYRSTNGQKQQQFMGESVAGTDWHRFSLWTYLPQPAHNPSFKMRLTHGEVDVKDFQVQLLDRHPQDELANNRLQWQSTLF